MPAARRVQICLAAEAIVWHGHGSTIGSNSNRPQAIQAGRVPRRKEQAASDTQHLPQAFPVTALVTFALLSQYLVDGAVENFRHALSGWWAGVRGETGPPAWFEP